MLHKHIAKHVSRFHAHILEHGHKRALVMIMSSMVMMFYPYFSTRADQVTLPSGGTIEIQYSPDDGPVNTDVVATVVVNTASGFDIINNQALYTYTFTENDTFVFEYEEEGIPGAIVASVNWIDKEAPTATIVYSGDPVTGPVTATMDDSEDTIVTSDGGPVHVFTENGTFLFTFEDPAGNTGSALATVSSIIAGDVCGNAIVETPEQCDDGNTEDNDGCNAICEIETNGGGNGGGGPSQDVCPAGDFSPSTTDDDCGTNPVCNGNALQLSNITHTRINNNATLVRANSLATGYNLTIDLVGNQMPQTFTNIGNVPMSSESFSWQLTTSPPQRFRFTIIDPNTGSPCSNSQIYTMNETLIDSGVSITGIVEYSICTGNQISAIATGFNMAGVFATNNNDSDNSLSYIFMSPGSFTFALQTTAGNTGSVTATATTGMFTNCSSGTITPPTPTLTGITATVSYTTGTIVTATATGFNMAGVFAVNNSNSLTHTFTSPGSFTFALQTAGGNTGSVTATATTGMFTTGSTSTGGTTGIIVTPPPSTTGTILTGTCDAGDLVLTGALGGVYSLTTPVVVGGLFSINWAAANNHCNPDQTVTIQLRDHNGQWITLGTGELDGTGVVFRSTGLAYTGLYNIFGTHASGSIYTYTGTSGQQLTGAYTVDTPYTIYTGAYTGAYTGLWTGYQVRIINASGVNLLSGARPFTIDNTLPSATGFTFIIGGANASGVVGSGGTFTLSFVGSELLSNIQLLVNNTLIKSWTGGSSTGYSLTGGFGASNLSGPIAYIVNFTDAAGNTGSVTGTNIYTIDTMDPNFQAFAVSGSAASGVKFTWNTNKSTVYNLQFSLSGSTGTVVPVNTTAYATSHTYTTTALANSKTYLFSIKINDALQNANFMSGTVTVNASGAASITIATQNNNVLQLSSQVEAKLFSQILKEEIKKFESCKSDIDFKSTTIALKGSKSINLKIPEMEKSSTKTIVQAFSLMLVNKLKSSNLSVAEIDETETKVNNFFVILKLLKDDKGDCKQNLSAYYINQFERIMDEMLK